MNPHFTVCWLIPVMFSSFFHVTCAKKVVPANVLQEELEEPSLIDKEALDKIVVIYII